MEEQGFHGNSILVRSLQDWELESMNTFLEDLYVGQINAIKVYRMIWLPSTSRGFQVKLITKLWNGGGMGGEKNFP